MIRNFLDTFRFLQCYSVIETNISHFSFLSTLKISQPERWFRFILVSLY
jgi:hypothetical protein